MIWIKGPNMMDLSCLQKLINKGNINMQVPRYDDWRFLCSGSFWGRKKESEYRQ